VSKFLDNTIALKSLCPDAEFMMYNNDYATVVWIVQPKTIPTAKEVSDELKRLTVA
jgi:hypothetical protein